MALGGHLGADQDVDLAGAPCARPRAVGLVAVHQRVGGEELDARLGKQLAAPPRPAARRRGRRRRSCRPRRSAGIQRPAARHGRSDGRPACGGSDARPARPSSCGHSMPLAAGAAERQRRIAAAIEEQQRLLARGQRLASSPRPPAATASGRAPAAVACRSTGGDRRGSWLPPWRAGRCSAAVAAGGDIDARSRATASPRPARSAPPTRRARTTAMSRAW